MFIHTILIESICASHWKFDWCITTITTGGDGSGTHNRIGKTATTESPSDSSIDVKALRRRRAGRTPLAHTCAARTPRERGERSFNYGRELCKDSRATLNNDDSSRHYFLSGHPSRRGASLPRRGGASLFSLARRRLNGVPSCTLMMRLLIIRR